MKHYHGKGLALRRISDQVKTFNNDFGEHIFLHNNNLHADNFVILWPHVDFCVKDYFSIIK